jgi:hypothetical protein
VAWICGGILRTMTLGGEAPGPVVRRPESLSLGIVEAGIVLGLLDLLFLAFVAVQLRYLFGGHAGLRVAGLTYAEYARRGFFELVAVAALVIPVVLLADALARPRRVFRALTVVLVVLLAVVMASAVERMRLYTDAYGLTELRLYTLAFMLWLAAVVVWMLATVLRDRHSWFMPGALVAGFATVALLNVVNPDALIARTNLDRHLEDGKELDSYYLWGLSADATPTIASRLDELDPDFRPELVPALDGAAGDWRTWNWGRSRAQDALDDYESRASAAKR